VYTAIRRYEGVNEPAEVVKRATEEFAPMLRDQPGFIGYWVVDAGAGVVATISVFETQAAADESTEAAAAWARERLADLITGAPQVTAGTTTAVRAG
jgi:heme-degrading monooxygenase HmoA